MQKIQNWYNNITKSQRLLLWIACIIMFAFSLLMMIEFDRGTLFIISLVCFLILLFLKLGQKHD